ncbi:MAG: thiol-disulfide oxidoreductase DCC family protein [Solirubrobacteraceae bacterium]
MAARSYSWTILYDSDCGFCRWSLAWVLRADRGLCLRPLPIDDPRAAPLLSGLSTEQRQDSWHLVAPDGECFSAGAAAPPLLRLLPGGRGPAALLAAAPGITERAYRRVARHRGALGRRLPTGSKSRADQRIAAVRRQAG